MLEYAVLNRLADGEVMREASLRAAAGAPRAVLLALLRKKWIAREDLSGVRDASRTIQVATLRTVAGKLNANQQAIVEYLRLQPEHSAHVSALRELAVPRTTLQTLVRRGIVELTRGAGELPHVGAEAAQAGVSVQSGAEGGARPDQHGRR